MEAERQNSQSIQFFDLNSDDGQLLRAYAWKPLGPQRANVIIAHGLGEHARRYAHVAAALNSAGIAVFAYDQRGHGEGAETLGDFSKAGWPGMLEDLKKLVEQVRSEQSGPVFLLGHSMGSMLAHHFMTRYSNLVDGVVLSGSPGFAPAAQIRMLLLLVRLASLRHGRNGKSPMLRNLLFGSANKRFDTVDSTGFEWLSRDVDEVHKYVNDPLCGATPTCGSTLSWFKNYRQALSNSAVASIRSDLPVFLFSGLEDPVGPLKNLERQLDAYESVGLKVDRKFYSKGRHEMFNELNRDVVIADLLAWLNKQIGDQS